MSKPEPFSDEELEGYKRFSSVPDQHRFLATIDALQSRLESMEKVLGEIKGRSVGTYKSPYGHGPEPNIDTRYDCNSCNEMKAIAREALEKEQPKGEE